MKKVVAIVMAANAIAISGTTYAKNPTDEQCSAATALAMTAFEARKKGMTEDMAMDMLRNQKIYSGLPVWAVKQAMRAPGDMAPWILRGSIFGECRKRDL